MELVEISEIVLEQQNVEDLKEFQITLRTYLRDKKEELAEIAKATKAENLQARKDAGLKFVKGLGVGGEVTVVYKDKSVTGTITKIKDNDKTFFLDIVWEGQTVNIWRYYENVVIPVTDEVDETIESEDE